MQTQCDAPQARRPLARVYPSVPASDCQPWVAMSLSNSPAMIIFRTSVVPAPISSSLIERNSRLISDSNSVLRGDPAVFKHELAGLAAAIAHFGQFLCDLESGKALFDDEGGNALRAF